MAVDYALRRERLLSRLEGSGIEIGALHRPVSAPHLAVTHVDRMTVSQLLEQYPELQGHPLVQPDILDDAETLGKVTSSSQDFVIANHVIEHMRNPIGALLAWQRVLKPGGRLFMAVPDRTGTFDRERPLTTIEHLLEDYLSPSKERDYEAFREFSRYVSCRCFNVKPESEAEEWAKHLADIDYSIHFHVWEFKTFLEFLNHVKDNVDGWEFQVIDEQPTEEGEFIFLLERR